ncbi:hypothetical protein [Oceanicoccus sp. KOV_DT_Chl]|uniref:hypothetical protein n=1 Tax=Oceanicoccus sp. KOV_DT_Chl TaxID=1904639 RepID=UPI000C7E723C|nr:hypothetical protein [Oceanicoccus sp. KOV_DT_Chl]
MIGATFNSSVKFLLVSILLAVMIFILNTFIRYDVIVGEILLADDLHFLPSALNSECEGTSKEWISEIVICDVVGAWSVYFGRLILIGFLTLSSILSLYIFRFAKVHLIYGISFSVAVFSGSPALAQSTFITGSHPSTGLLFVLFSIFFVTYSFLGIGNKWFKIIYLVLGGLAMLLAGIATSNLLLASLILLPFFIYAVYEGYGRFLLCSLFLASLVPSLLLGLLEFSGIFSNHYNSIPGLISVNFDRILTQIAEFKGYVHSEYTSLSSVFIVVATIVATYIVCTKYWRAYLLVINGSLLNKVQNPVTIRVAFMAASVVGFIVTLAPLLVVNYKGQKVCQSRRCFSMD